MAQNKIILKVVDHGKASAKCRWGVFLNDKPLAECDCENAIKSGRNIYLMAQWAKAYADEHGYKVTKLILDAIGNEELKTATEKAQELGSEKAKADKKAADKLEELLAAKDDNERKTLRKEWGELCEIAEKAGNVAKEAQAKAIATSDQWFERRKAEQA